MKKLILFFLLICGTAYADPDSYREELAARKERRIQIGMYKANQRRERVLFRKNYEILWYQAQLYAMQHPIVIQNYRDRDRYYEDRYYDRYGR